jgi:hypothetical protein
VQFRAATGSGELSPAAEAVRAAMGGDLGGSDYACASERAWTEGVMAPPKRPARRDGFDMGLMPKVESLKRLVVHTGGKKNATVGMRWLRKNPEVALKTLVAWITAVRAVALRCALPVDAIGFTFAPHAEAEFVRVKGRFALLINPTTIHIDSEFAAEELLDRALHETAHLCTTGGHDEDFVVTEFSLRRKVRAATVRGAVARALYNVEVQTVEE